MLSGYRMTSPLLSWRFSFIFCHLSYCHMNCHCAHVWFIEYQCMSCAWIMSWQIQFIVWQTWKWILIISVKIGESCLRMIRCPASCIQKCSFSPRKLIWFLFIICFFFPSRWYFKAAFDAADDIGAASIPVQYVHNRMRMRVRMWKKKQSKDMERIEKQYNCFCFKFFTQLELQCFLRRTAVLCVCVCCV